MPGQTNELGIFPFSFIFLSCWGAAAISSRDLPFLIRYLIRLSQKKNNLISAAKLALDYTLYATES
jgi:hypothetical protein